MVKLNQRDFCTFSPRFNLVAISSNLARRLASSEVTLRSGSAVSMRSCRNLRKLVL